MKNFWNLFQPHTKVPAVWEQGVKLVFAAALILLWCFPPSKLIPTPWEALQGIGYMWMEDGLSRHLWGSTVFVITALAISTIVSLTFAYLTVLPVGRPPATFLEVNRFLGITGLPFLFATLLHDILLIKLTLMVFFMSVWFVTAMNEIVRSVTTDELNYARTLGMGRWRVVWEIVILGNADKAWTTILQIHGMGWVMLAPVEMLARSEGGIGILIEVKKRTGDYHMILGIILITWVIAVLFDQILRWVRNTTCPWANLKVARS